METKKRKTEYKCHLELGVELFGAHADSGTDKDYSGAGVGASF